MSENTPVSKDEIDLGQVLKIIGNFFEKVFNFIKDVALTLFNLLVKLLLLIKENILKFLIVGLVSFIIGFLIDSYSKPVFSSGMNIQPNFGSTNQIYSDIRYYDGLISVQDSVALSSIFGITQQEAASLTTINIQPVRDENEMLKKYDYFNMNIEDTLNTPEFGYQRFKLNISPTEFSNHLITAEAKDPLVFKKLQDSIIKGSIEGNKYLINNRKKEKKNYALQDSALAKQERKIDSLRSIYSLVMLKNAEKTETSGTNIQLAASQTKTYEMELFKLEHGINVAKQKLNTDRALRDDMINVISGFQKRGKQTDVELYDRKAVKFLTYGMILLFLFLFIKGLNTYLNNYKNKINA